MKKLIRKRNCKYCHKWFYSETKFRQVCDKCKKSNWKKWLKSLRDKIK